MHLEHEFRPHIDRLVIFLQYLLGNVHVLGPAPILEALHHSVLIGQDLNEMRHSSVYDHSQDYGGTNFQVPESPKVHLAPSKNWETKR